MLRYPCALPKLLFPFGCVFGIKLLFNMLVVTSLYGRRCFLTAWCVLCGGYSFSAVLSVTQF